MSLPSSTPIEIKAKPAEERRTIGPEQERPTVSSTRVIKSATRLNQIPPDLLNDPIINSKIAAALPTNYNFEIHKTIWRIRTTGARRVALQFPEGLFIFATAISDILTTFTDCDVMILGDVIYGACCIDDITASALSCDLLVHYGHSCLVPIPQMKDQLKILYVFVDIKFDMWHLIETIKLNFKPETDRIALGSTIQFVQSIHLAAKVLRSEQGGGFQVHIDQLKPLSPGEVLGCSAPKLSPDLINCLVFVADGRFHLEALMIANPHLRDRIFKYDPYSKKLTHEKYDTDKMVEIRSKAISTSCARINAILDAFDYDLAPQKSTDNSTIGIILGTLGRQGSPSVLNHLRQQFLKLFTSASSSQTHLNLLIPEINPAQLAQISGVAAWVQIACPRLSIDWGEGFEKQVSAPLLTPYEFNLVIKTVLNERSQDSLQVASSDSIVNKLSKNYPMDFYAKDSLGAWTPSHKCHSSCECEQ